MIEDVKLNVPTKEKATQGAYTTFTVTMSDGTIMHVPADPANRHYWEIREWYLAQEHKPFEFEFDTITETEGQTDANL